jgi:hypothetical protein
VAPRTTPVDHDREQEGRDHRHGGDTEGEQEGPLQGGKIGGILQHRLEVLEPDELHGETERVLEQRRHPNGLTCRPEEEHQSDGNLRREQQIGQQLMGEDDLAFHRGRSNRGVL